MECNRRRRPGRTRQGGSTTKRKKNNDERGEGSAAVATTISATLVRVCLCGLLLLLLLLLSPRRTRVDLPSFLDRFLAAAEFVRRVTDDGFWAMDANNTKKIASPTECTFSQTCTLSTPDLVVRSVWLVVCRGFAVVIVR